MRVQRYTISGTICIAFEIVGWAGLVLSGTDLLPTVKFLAATWLLPDHETSFRSLDYRLRLRSVIASCFRKLTGYIWILGSMQESALGRCTNFHVLRKYAVNKNILSFETNHICFQTITTCTKDTFLRFYLVSVHPAINWEPFFSFFTKETSSLLLQLNIADSWERMVTSIVWF